MPVFLERFVLPLSSGLVLLLMFTNPMHWGWPPRIIGTVIAVALASVAAILVHRSKEQEGTGKDTKKQGPTYIPKEVTLASLMMRFKDPTQTTVQAQKSLETFVGKWTRYTGTIDNVMYNNRLVFTKFPDDSNDFRYVAANFDKRWKEHLDMLPPGKTVTVEGQISSFEFSRVELNKCEFIETE
jgi:hypothetical protein